MEQNELRYPIGIQTFEDIINGGYVYVDKTEYVYKMTRSKYLFLSRPRRFGKSLLVSTLRSYFEGRKDLFKGLAIEGLEKDWTQYPVVHISLASAKGLERDALVRTIDDLLAKNEQRLGVERDGVDLNTRFKNLVLNTSNKYGQKVAILIDEYDAPLLDVVHKDEELEVVRQTMRSFYAPLKDLDPQLRFVLITGITKFSQLSIFSELNNLDNISMQEPYAGVCGITEEEMVTQLSGGVEALAQKQGMTTEEAVAALKENYDGYHFTWPSPDVYNPFSLLNALDKKNFSSYWFASGTPTYLIEMLRKFNVSPSRLGKSQKAVQEDFDAPTERMTSITPLLYQSGYTTIKDCNSRVELYTLDLPNREVRIGLMKSLLPNYLGAVSVEGNATVAMMQEALLDDDIDNLLQLLQTFLGTVPQTKNTGYEGHWQQMLYTIFSLLGANCDVEVHTATGRVDLVARTANKLYLVELKINKSANAAIEQIDLKGYDKRFALCGLPVVKVGVNFNLKKRNITDWKVE